MPEPASTFSTNAARFRGDLELYNRYRPPPPPFLRDLVCNFGRMPRPGLVVDLGCGTGLSTRFWIEHADRVIGIDPNPGMLEIARGATAAVNVTFQAGFSHTTGLAAASADLVTCCQSIHWMEPATTLTELARVLKPGGVFVAVNYDFPPTIDWELDLALSACLRRIRQRTESMGLPKNQKRWASGHVATMARSGNFRHVKEIAMHRVDTGDAGRLMGCVRTMGDVAESLQRGATQAELGLDELEHTARRIIGTRPANWCWSYAALLAINK